MKTKKIILASLMGLLVGLSIFGGHFWVKVHRSLNQITEDILKWGDEPDDEDYD